jgi:hypothetical protein
MIAVTVPAQDGEETECRLCFVWHRELHQKFARHQNRGIIRLKSALA